jgi:hypothetical protein
MQLISLTAFILALEMVDVWEHASLRTSRRRLAKPFPTILYADGKAPG